MALIETKFSMLFLTESTKSSPEQNHRCLFPEGIDIIIKTRSSLLLERELRSATSASLGLSGKGCYN